MLDPAIARIRARLIARAAAHDFYQRLALLAGIAFLACSAATLAMSALLLTF